MAILAVRSFRVSSRLLASSLLALSLLSSPAAFATGADPLQGADLQQLEVQKEKLNSQKMSPEGAAALSILPGAGHFYAGQNARGAWVLGGFAGTLLVSFIGSYLLSSLDHTAARTAAVMVNIAPPAAYWAWSMSDAYYQTSLQNLAIERQIQDISLKQKEYGHYSTIFQFSF